MAKVTAASPGFPGVRVLAVALSVWAAAGASEAQTPAADHQAVTDSLDLYEEILSSGAASDEAHAAAMASELAGASSGVRPVRPGRWDLGLEITAGYRDAARVETGWGTGTAGPLLRFHGRRDSGRFGGYVDIQRAGPIVRLTAGGIRPAFGEGLALGVRYVPFASPRTGGRLASAAPTASTWGGKRGVAVTVNAVSGLATVAAWRDRDGGSAAWTCWGWRSSAGAFALAAGAKIPARVGAGASPEAAGVSIHLERRLAGPGGGVLIAGETAVIRSRLFAVGHAVITAGSTWNVSVFCAPTPGSYSAGVVAPGDELRRQTGGAIHRTGEWRGITTRVSIYSGTRRAAGEVLGRRRVDASARGRAGVAAAGYWSLAVRLAEDTESGPSGTLIDTGPSSRRTRDGQLRGGWTGNTGRVLRHSYRATASFGRSGVTRLVGTVSWTLSAGRLEGTCQVSNYAIAAGETGYVIRPGLPGAVTVDAVTDNGSDISARVRAGLGSLRLNVHWSQRWGAAARWYVSLGARM